jgi:hypothetical protein
MDCACSAHGVCEKYTNLLGNIECKRQLSSHKHGWSNGIEASVQGRDCEALYCIKWAHSSE